LKLADAVRKWLTLNILPRKGEHLDVYEMIMRRPISHFHELSEICNVENIRPAEEWREHIATNL